MNRPTSRSGARRALTALLLGGASLVPALSSAQTAFPASPLHPSQTTRPASGRALAGAPVRASAPAPVYSDTAPPQPGYDAGSQVVRVDTGAGPARSITLPKGKSAVIELPVDARDVMVSDPKVADVVLSTPRRIYVTGQGSGATNAMFVDGMGRQILRLNIRVDQDVASVSETMARLMPQSAIRVEAANDSLILSGEAANASEADRALRLAQSFVLDKTKVVNLIAVSGSEQVMLKVKIVEVNRTVLKQLGFDLSAITGQLGMPQYAFTKAPTYGVNGSFLGSASGGYSVNTTSQPVSGFPFSNILSGLSQSSSVQSAASAAGIALNSIGSIIGQFLTGSSPLTTAQSTFAQNAVTGVLGSTSTTVTPIVAGVAGTAYTVNSGIAGITSSNIGQLDQAYLNGTLSNYSIPTDNSAAAIAAAAKQATDRNAFLQAFNSQLNSNSTYNNTTPYSLPAGQNSTYVDRSNPANYVQRGVAGSTGLNQANAMIQAFERVGLVRTLAEPTLTAISGESAKFLAGGEFPVPTSQDNNGRVSIEFKPFGVGLGFTPVVLGPGRISLKLSTEVSELSSVGGFTLGTSSVSAGGGSTAGPSLSIPALNVRRAETVVELPSGGSMMIAGLMQSQTKQTLDSLPGLQQLPVLGALFRSRDFQNNETELVVIVTPYLVKSVRPDQLQTPADGLVIASDIETNLLGRLNTSFNKKPEATANKTYQGPFGYVVD